ncbi:MAG: Plug and carboxypeptidase regulatory-like domain-containing protein, partial [Acidobacteriota bacterium]|nr:Plug and carboxypeptidase regulatory-like domain-containing protein [Acidobacteriota bacterium]
MSHPRTATRILFAAIVSLCALPALAQAPEGRITGVVRTAGGDPVPGVTITITNQQTGATRVGVSGANGAYDVAAPSPGLYTVTADLPGVGQATVRSVQVVAGSAAAVDVTLDPRFREAVTVTAMKREETVLDTPVSVAAPTEEVLRERGADSLEGVAANVAGFSVQNLGPGQSQISMRGISSGQIARDQPGPKEEVGVYLDESVVSFLLFTPDMDLFD